jgi:hypothetical protein
MKVGNGWSGRGKKAPVDYFMVAFVVPVQWLEFSGFINGLLITSRFMVETTKRQGFLLGNDLIMGVQGEMV